MPLKLKAPAVGRRSTRVAVWQIAEVLDEVMPGLDREASCSLDPPENHGGGLDLLAQRISTLNNGKATPESIIRKLYDARRGNRATFDAGFADEVLMALGKTFASAGIAVVPGSGVAAKEMVEAHAEIRDDGAFYTGMKTQKQLMESLLHFSLGFVFCDAEVIEVPDEAAVAA